MSEENKTPVSQNEDKTEIQKALQQIPHDELIAFLAEYIQNRPSEGSQQAAQTIVSQQVSQRTFSGPIPDPKTLSEYAAAGPDIADRIVKMAEAEQQHQQEQGNKLLDAAIKTEKRGQHYALFISLTVIIGAAYLIGIDKEIYGSVLGGSTLLGLVYLFVTGKKENKE